VSAFAEPNATRVMCRLLGLPEHEWPTFAAWSATIGLGLRVTIARDLPRIEEALEGLFGYAGELIVARQRDSGEDFVSRLVLAHENEDRLSDRELRVAGDARPADLRRDRHHQEPARSRDAFVRRASRSMAAAVRTPGARAPALEEVMRVRPTVTWVTRLPLRFTPALPVSSDRPTDAV
jgi:hypothetical protein